MIAQLRHEHPAEGSLDVEIPQAIGNNDGSGALLSQAMAWNAVLTVKWVPAMESGTDSGTARDLEGILFSVVPGSCTVAGWLDEALSLAMQHCSGLPALAKVYARGGGSERRHVGDAVVESFDSLESEQIPNTKDLAMSLSEQKRTAGNAFREKGQPADVVRSYCEAIQHARAAAVLCLDQSEPEDEVQALERAAHLNLSLALKEVGEWRGAVLRCDELAMRAARPNEDGSDGKLAFRRGTALCAGGIDHIAGARELRRAAGQDPDNARVLNLIARAEVDAKRTAEKHARDFESNYAASSVTLAKLASPPALDLSF
mmetsp:Transcript_4261/g.9283  ORF Transcript_4261/g.9283 Transcript_4261/m.9283 type:complete len:316 (-) Transcript_4261:311-1258(-)